MKKQGPKYFFAGGAMAAMGLLGFMLTQPETGTYDDLAMCLEEKGATFYGAFWCPHCNDQKDMFGASADKLPYVECSTPDGQNQTNVCKDAQISSYPTWEFGDGERVTGAQSMEKLAEKTGCPLPETQ